jgi:dipeptidyl aminopeptidase/acylaminoacyl peptidase
MTTVRSLIAVLLLLAALAAQADDQPQAEAEKSSGELTFDDLFRQAAIRHAALSPNGEYVAFFRHNTLVMGKPGVGYFNIRKFNDRLFVEDLDWIGPNTVWVTSWDPKNSRYLETAIRFSDLGDDGYGLDMFVDHAYFGYVADVLTDEENHIVIAQPESKDDTITAVLYRVNAFRPFNVQLLEGNRIKTGSEGFFYYQKNSAGEYTLGIRITEGVPEIWRKLPDAEGWALVWTADKESTFIPWSMSDDALTLWVLTDAESDRVVAAEFDLESRRISKVLFEHERVDVDAIFMADDNSEPVGVTYFEQGLLRYHFFSEEQRLEHERLKSYFPDQGIVTVGYAAGTDARLVFASSPTERGSIHVCHLQKDECSLVESMAPWMEGKPLSKTVPLAVQSSDGLVVDAFLTLPVTGDEQVPLIAMPHGGPIGVSDDRYFSSDVQWLAHNGYAVLQVNYRGSGGYGKDFASAGLRQWGRGIEDDIEAAVRRAIENYPIIDGDRVGIYGASYGGYSALMSVIRNPALFKCAASFAGVTDLTLLFTQYGKRRTERLRETLIRYVGDPNIDYAEQTENSPVYRYRDIKRPILLAHGMDDPVVDFEHSWRMQKMLRLTGTAPKFILLRDVGHGFGFIDEAKELYDPLMEFLDRHLKPANPAAADAG